MADNKVGLNSKYIIIKQNKKLKKQFFRLFQVFYSVNKFTRLNCSRSNKSIIYFIN